MLLGAISQAAERDPLTMKDREPRVTWWNAMYNLGLLVSVKRVRYFDFNQLY
jgi:hypothetical protein